jgi:hypothetical protein
MITHNHYFLPNEIYTGKIPSDPKTLPRSERPTPEELTTLLNRPCARALRFYALTDLTHSEYA